ncbi:amidohydrolase family protein [Alicyclobacillus sp. ALC3]|uniref:amidohydrolase family protein n=1 Tax=Alicyclobacillus sp. ALC3 TaxID=2796143 RepID=UPI0023786A67|nr:amidohydrolase family protein [Alicyclobacillus sp. ALC3]WDL97747.1 amidohydrolase [Alicyclobacillus sp. ALC3]
MVIDVHGHVVAPPELYAYQASLLASRGAHGKGGVSVSDERLMKAVWGARAGEPATHIELLNGVGTDVQFISPRPFHAMHSMQPERIVHWYTEAANDIIARLCNLFPGRFQGVAGLPQSAGTDVRHTLPELERCVKELGFIGCMINPDPYEGTGTPPGMGEEYWYPLYEKLVELDVPALIHSASCVSPRESYSLHFINEETIAVMSLLNSNVFRDFPNLKLIISHAGGAVPYQIGRFMAGRYRNPKAEPFEESMRRLYFDTCLYTQDSLELLFRTVGPDRCLFGTENPGTASVVNPNTGQYMDNTHPIIERIEWLSEEDKEGIFHRNAEQLFRLA